MPSIVSLSVRPLPQYTSPTRLENEIAVGLLPLVCLQRAAKIEAVIAALKIPIDRLRTQAVEAVALVEILHPQWPRTKISCTLSRFSRP